MSARILVSKVDPKAMIPVKATKGSAGYDLFYQGKDVSLSPHTQYLFDLGIKMQIPEGYEGQIRSRSGLASKGIVVTNSPGTIDSDYRGTLKVMLTNHTDQYYVLEEKDRIAQLIISKVPDTFMLEVPLEELGTTTRGSGGIGSTGR